MTTVRMLIVAVVAAAILGFAAGWWGRIWTEPTPESRAHDAAEQIKERVHQMTH